MFANERRMAKVLNFSIAYGKTEHGLSKDWNISIPEAKKTVDRWYADRPEVLKWQDQMRKEAGTLGRVLTLLGRERRLPDALASNKNNRTQSHALRAAINTPIQGGAADVVMAAMLRIWRDERLKALGYRMLLQVHDEVILEGPEGNVEAAQARVVELMQNPFGSDDNVVALRVELVVDADNAVTWLEAK